MHSLVHVLTFLLAFASAVLGAPNAKHHQPPGGTAYCYTQQLTSKGNLHYTRWSTWHTCTKTKTSTKTTTTTAVTVSTVTSTTVTTATAPATTNTATDTTTITSTTTSTSTSTASASTATTTTVPAIFAPISDTLPGAVYSPIAASKKKRSDGGNSELDGSLKEARRIPKQGWPGPVQCWSYPSTCVTSTATKTSTTTVHSTSTTTTTTTSTYTTTPGVSTTITVTVNPTTTVLTTVTSTTTMTTTSTVTSPIDAAAACETTAYSNYADYVGTFPIAEADGTGPNYNGYASPDSGNDSVYDCCLAAFADPVGVFFAYQIGQPTGFCNVLEANTCTAGQASDPGNTADLGAAGSTPVYIIGNAACGTVSLTTSE
ncbi:hypothetical protein BDY17DRAFT_324534 [Neohortaea acidophila]|uniref:Apple domain-containing protein n=1 Tax=Neohortaea acidophila TaxID=245834 RepID=A0A6A6PQ58_9PEZI|nr:uncharacterized protein BDY17DRAFT_324534 [Neohortaea acidophila]KAF2482238.1 hypothetical protein BDY17DRAFT_324534 [Neohortaea acidophila]